MGGHEVNNIGGGGDLIEGVLIRVDRGENRGRWCGK